MGDFILGSLYSVYDLSQYADPEPEIKSVLEELDQLTPNDSAWKALIKGGGK